MPLEEVRARAQAAKEAGATRFCMGAAWRSPKKSDVEAVAAMIREVRALGMETCATLGMLTPDQAHELKDAGLDYYNHNVDTSPEFYGEIITTRTYQDRLDTLAAVRDAGPQCVLRRHRRHGRNHARPRLDARDAREPSAASGERADQPAGARAGHAARRARRPWIRSTSCARLPSRASSCPRPSVRLSAGREVMSDELQALCFLAGANSIFYGEKLLTTGNPDVARDRALLTRLGIEPLVPPGLAAAPGERTAPTGMCTGPIVRTRRRARRQSCNATRQR